MPKEEREERERERERERNCAHRERREGTASVVKEAHRSAAAALRPRAICSLLQLREKEAQVSAEAVYYCK